MTVDRTNRDRLIEAINRYLDEDLTAFGFAEAIDDIAAESDDPTVAEVVALLWHHYDDLKDHKVVLSKEQWDYFQRLVLLLESDAQLEVQKRRTWSPRQLIAAAGLAIFGVGLLRLGWGLELLAVTIPLGGVSMLLDHWRERSTLRPTRRWVALTPFASVAQILALRRDVARFSKRRYPPDLKTRRIRSRFMDAVLTLTRYAMWLLASPVALAVQSWPETQAEERVVTA